MKRTVLPVTIIALTLTIISCGKGGSSFESDIRKVAEYRCKIEKLQSKAATDESAKKEMTQLMDEMRAFAEKVETKYADKKDDKEFNAKADKIMDEVMEKCK